jgi:hypothetical protein
MRPAVRPGRVLRTRCRRCRVLWCAWRARAQTGGAGRARAPALDAGYRGSSRRVKTQELELLKNPTPSGRCVTTSDGISLTDAAAIHVELRSDAEVLAPIAHPSPSDLNRVPNWRAGDTIALGARSLRVVDVRDDDPDQPPAVVVEDVSGEERGSRGA